MRMQYRLFKQFFTGCHFGEYDPNTKTIEVDLPSRPTIRFPSNWIADGNSLTTPTGIVIRFWNRGWAESFFVSWDGEDRMIYPGVNARQRVLDTVAEFEAKKIAKANRPKSQFFFFCG